MRRREPDPASAQVSHSHALGKPQGSLFPHANDGLFGSASAPTETSGRGDLPFGVRAASLDSIQTRNAEPSLDQTRERRVKALACTEPLHALHTNRGRRDWDRFDFYDLGLAAIDAVVDKMRFDTGISRD